MLTPSSDQRAVKALGSFGLQMRRRLLLWLAHSQVNAGDQTDLIDFQHQPYVAMAMIARRQKHAEIAVVAVALRWHTDLKFSWQLNLIAEDCCLPTVELRLGGKFR